MKPTLRIIYLSCILLALFTSCSKTEEDTKPSTTAFHINFKDIKATIPIIHYLSYQPQVTAQMAFNLDSIVKANQDVASANKTVTSIKVERVELKLLNADDANNFSNFEHCNIAFLNASNSEAILVAESQIPTTSTSTLTLQGRNTELLNYVKSGKITIMVNGKARNATNKELFLAMDYVVKIEQQDAPKSSNVQP